MSEQLFVLRSLVGGGVETTALTLHRYLVELGPARLALLEDFGELRAQSEALPGILRPPAARGTPTGKEDLWFALRSGGRFLGYRRRIRDLVRERRPAVLFTHSGLDLLACARGVRVPWVAGVGSDVLRDVTSKHPTLEWPLRHLLSWLYRGPDRLVVASRGLSASLRDRLGVPPERLTVIPNPVDLQRVSAGVAERVETPAAYVLGVGRLGRVKGFDVLVRALAGLDLDLVLLGEGEERSSLQRLAAELGVRLHLPGFVPNPWAWMRGARAVAVSSFLEGFSNVAVEALACDVPLVVTDCPHGPREIVDEGQFGTVVATGDPAALAAGLLAEMGLAREGRRERAAEFDAPVIAGRYAQMLASAAAEK